MILAIGSDHLRRVDRASSRRVRKMAKTAVRRACAKARESGLRPVTMVDDLTMQGLGPWLDDFARGLASGAREAGISIVGGEMAQMSDTYRPGYVGCIVTVVAV